MLGIKYFSFYLLELFFEYFLGEILKRVSDVPILTFHQSFLREFRNPIRQVLIARSEFIHEVSDHLVEYELIVDLKSEISKQARFTRERTNHALKKRINRADGELRVAMKDKGEKPLATLL